MTTTIQQGTASIELERITIPDNVRALDTAHVNALAGSIALQGQLVPVIVRPAGDGFELVAGFHRFAAVQQLGLTHIEAVQRDGENEDAQRAIENIARKQLNPYEEARAVHALLERGLTLDGAAQALGWSRHVSARVRRSSSCPSARSAWSATPRSAWARSTTCAQSERSHPRCWSA